MTMMHEGGKSSGGRIMYIRGVPFTCPESRRNTEEEAVNDAEAKVRVAENQASDAIAASVVPACSRELFARCASAGAGRGVLPRFTSKTQEALMKSRRAMRLFSPVDVPMRVLRDLIGVAVGETAPDAIEPRFVVVEAAEPMARITALVAAWMRREGVLLDGPVPAEDAQRKLFGGARHMAVAYGPSGEIKAATACARAVARLEWAAIGAGLGVCFAGEIVQAASCASDVAAALTVPQGHTAYAVVLLGYPAFPADQPATGHPTRIIWL